MISLHFSNFFKTVNFFAFTLIYETDVSKSICHVPCQAWCLPVKVLLWTLTLSADLPKSLWCSAVGLDQDFAFSYQTMESSLKHLPVLIIHKSRICPFHTFDLWIYLLLLMCGHSKRFNHDLMHISEAWAGFFAVIISNLKHQKCISWKVIANLTLNHFLHLLCCLPRSHFSDLSVLHLLKACFTTIIGPAMIHCPCILKWYFQRLHFYFQCYFCPIKSWLAENEFDGLLLF